MAPVDRSLLVRLEEKARLLTPGPEERAGWLRLVDGHTAAWLEALDDLPARVPDGEVPRAALAALPIRNDPRPLPEVLAALRLGVDTIGLNESSGSFFGFIPGSGNYAAALADYAAAVVNRYAGVYYAAPGAVRLGRACLEWLAAVVGYPADCGGDITSGGSIATLSAVVAAREARGLRAADFDGCVVYLTAQTHHAVDKAIRIAGLGGAERRLVPLDGRYRMRPDALARLIDDDRAAGRRPFLVVASAGTTDTGAVDPLAAVADVCAARDVWLHVDAAYGGAFALTGRGRELLAGLERADSMVIDPHKGFFLPFGTGVVLVRERSDLVRAFSATAGYMEDALAVEPAGALSPAELSPELTRPFRALRWWLSLQLGGVEAHRAALEEKLLLARHAHERLAARDGFIVGPEPDLTIFTFRIAGGDAANRALVDAIRDDGRIYLSATTLDGRYTPRFAVLNVGSHLAEVDRAVDVIAELAAGLRP